MTAIDASEGTSARRRVFGWMMFDWASQPFFTLCLTFVFGPYFAVAAAEWFAAGGAAPEEAAANAQSAWSAGLALTGIAIAVTAPLLGALADTGGRRMPWIVGFSVLYVIGTAGLWVMTPDGAAMWLALAFFGLAMIGVEYTTIFTNALLPSLGTPGEIGRISGTGYALGYAGGVLSLAVMLLAFAENEAGVTLIGRPPPFGLDPDAREGTRLVGPFAALWFAVFMIPFFAYVREPRAPAPRASLGRAWADLRTSLASVARRRSLAAYLAGSMLYRDALAALYGFGGTYAVLVLGWSVVQVGVFGILAAITAGVASWIGGHLDMRHGPKPVIVACILALMAVSGVLAGMDRTAFFGVPLPEGSGLPDLTLYAMGCVIGGAGGVLQSASRSMMVRHATPERPTEAFGLYALSGKATAFLGPALIGAATYLTVSPRMGFVPVIALFALGLTLMRFVRPAGDVGAPEAPVSGRRALLLAALALGAMALLFLALGALT